MPRYTTDAELITGMRSGDSIAFKEAHVRYFAMVRYLVLNNNGRPEDAQDVFQEALVILYEQLCSNRFEQQSSLKTWIYAVCRNRWLKQLERKSRQTKFIDFETAETILIPEEKEERSLQHRQLREALTRMGGQCRKLLLLFYYFRKSMEEIALELNYTNADNAKTQKYKCIQRLRTTYSNLVNQG